MRAVEVIWMIIKMTVPEHNNVQNLMISWRVWWFLTATGLAMLNLWRPLQVSECAPNLESFHIMNVNIKIMVVKQNVWKISLFRSKSWYLEFMGKSNKSVNGLEKRWNWIWRKRPLSGPNLEGLPSLVFLVGTCFQPPADVHWLI